MTIEIANNVTVILCISVYRSVYRRPCALYIRVCYNLQWLVDEDLCIKLGWKLANLAMIVFERTRLNVRCRSWPWRLSTSFIVRRRHCLLHVITRQCHHPRPVTIITVLSVSWLGRRSVDSDDDRWRPVCSSPVSVSDIQRLLRLNCYVIVYTNTNPHILYDWPTSMH